MQSDNIQDTFDSTNGPANGAGYHSYSSRQQIELTRDIYNVTCGKNSHQIQTICRPSVRDEDHQENTNASPGRFIMSSHPGVNTWDLEDSYYRNASTTEKSSWCAQSNSPLHANLLKETNQPVQSDWQRMLMPGDYEDLNNGVGLNNPTASTYQSHMGYSTIMDIFAPSRGGYYNKPNSFGWSPANQLSTSFNQIYENNIPSSLLTSGSNTSLKNSRNYAMEVGSSNIGSSRVTDRGFEVNDFEIGVSRQSVIICSQTANRFQTPKDEQGVEFTNKVTSLQNGRVMRHPPPGDDKLDKVTTRVTASTSTGKTRTKDKYRTVYSETQKAELERHYLSSTYISSQRKADISRSVSLSERQVKIWFQNRRAKDRKCKNKQVLNRHPAVTCDMFQEHGRASQPIPDVTHNGLSLPSVNNPACGMFGLRHSAAGLISAISNGYARSLQS